MDDNLLWQPLKGAEERSIRLVFDAYKQYTCFLLYKFLQTGLKTFFFKCNLCSAYLGIFIKQPYQGCYNKQYCLLFIGRLHRSSKADADIVLDTDV